MKFNEFVALSEHLEENGSSINEFVYDVTGAYLFEADEIETSRAGKGFHSPKFALKRTKLNNNAKKFLQGAKEKVIDKYSPKILGSTKNLITKAAALKEEGKNPGEINKLLGKEASRAIAQQEKSIERLDVIIDKIEAVYTKRVEDILRDSQLSEKNKGALSIYWAMLVLQVRQLLDKSLVKYREDMIEEALGNNPEMEKMLKLMYQSPNWKQKMQDYKDSIESKKKEFKEAEAGGDEAQGGEEKSAEGEEKPAEETPAKKEVTEEDIKYLSNFTPGKKYKYDMFNKDGKATGKTSTLKVVGVKDGKLQVKFSVNQYKTTRDLSASKIKQLNLVKESVDETGESMLAE